MHIEFLNHEQQNTSMLRQQYHISCTFWVMDIIDNAQTMHTLNCEASVINEVLAVGGHPEVFAHSMIEFRNHAHSESEMQS